MNALKTTARSQVKRLPERGDYSRETLYGILDEAMVCHVGFAVEGKSFVIPMIYGRVDNVLYIHGSPASRMLRSLATGVDICVTVTIQDGLVLARSALHHSMNYRSAMIFGTAYEIEDSIEKEHALRAISEHIVPGRWKDVRPPTAQELRATSVLRLLIIEASSKVRTGPPLDDDEDYNLPIWAGVLPLRVTTGAPVADPRVIPGIEAPLYLTNYARKVSR